MIVSASQAMVVVARSRRRPPLRQRQRLLLPLLLLLMLLQAGRVLGYEKYLFLPDAESQVEELVGAAALAGVKEGKTGPCAVMFYSPTCPHCTRFAPTWTEVAAAMAGTAIRVAAVSCLAEPTVCQQEHINNYPTLVAFGLQDPNAPASLEEAAGKKKKPDGGVVIRDQSRDKIVAWLKNHYRAHFSSSSSSSAAAEEEVDGAGETRAVHEDKEEEEQQQQQQQSSGLGPAELRRRRAADAFTSLRFAMDHDVFLGASVLKEDALDALKDLLRALVLLFPGAARRQAFAGLLGAIEPMDELSIAEWEAQTAQHVAPLVPKGEGGDDYRWTLARPDAGYTGGLWFLFHILTARAAVASAEDQDPRVQPPFVLGVVHGFVEHFFGCAECKGHFLKAYEAVRGTWEAQGAKGAVLWIWDLHDQVNTRLDKPRWPSRGGCPRCWKGAAPQHEAIYERLIRAYDIRDAHLRAPGAGVEAEDGEESPEQQMVALTHDYVFIGLLALIVLGAAVWKLERKLSLGRQKKRSEGRLEYDRVEVEVVDRV